MQRALLKQKVLVPFALLFVFVSFGNGVEASELHDKAGSSEEHEFLDLPSLYPGLSESARSSGALGVSGGSQATFRITSDGGIAMNGLSGTVQVDDEGISGSNIDFEDDLGIDNESTARFGVLAQLSMFRIGFAFQDMSFSSTEPLGRDILYAATTYAQGTNLKTEIDNTYYRAELGITPFEFGMVELGFSLGAHLFDFAVSLEGPGTLAGAAAPEFRREDKDFFAPVPTFGVHAGIYPTDSIAIEPQLMLIVVPEIDGMKGTLVEFSVQGKYYLLSNLALGARVGYMQFMVDVDTDEADDAETFIGDFDLNALQVGVVVGLSF